jgi:hypothetical protein
VPWKLLFLRKTGLKDEDEEQITDDADDRDKAALGAPIATDAPTNAAIQAIEFSPPQESSDPEKKKKKKKTSKETETFAFTHGKSVTLTLMNSIQSK